MKKKFIAVYALIGVLALGSTALTSCVDDNESASVTAIRDAKAQQLKAMAEAETALANLRNAKAAIKEAEAANAAALLPQIEAEVAAQVQLSKNKLEGALQTLVQNQNSYIQGLAYQYNTAQTNVINLTADIADKELLLAQYKAGLVEAQAIAEKNILGYEKTIAADSAALMVYKELGETSSTVELQKQLDELSAELTIKQNEVNNANSAKTNAENAFSAAQEAWEGATKTDGKDGSTTIDPTLKAGVALNLLKNKSVDGAMLLNSEVKYSDEEKEVSEASIAVYSLNQDAVNAYRVATLQQAITEAENAKGDKDDAAVADPYSGTPGLTDTYFAYYNYFNDYKEACDEALKEAQDALKVDPTDEDLQAAVTEAQNDVTLAQNSLTQAKKNYLDKADEAIEKATSDLEEFDAAVADLAADSQAYKDYLAAVDAVLANEGKAVVEAVKAYNDAIIAYAAVEAEQGAINTLISNVGKFGPNKDLTLEEEIARLEADIAEQKKEIVIAESLAKPVTSTEIYEDYDDFGRLSYTIEYFSDGSYVCTYYDVETGRITETQKYAGKEQITQALCDKTEDEIAALNVQLENAELIAEKLKSDLESALNGSGTTTTPSEGEETPAA